VKTKISIIPSEAKLQGSPESARGDAKLPISRQIRATSYKPRETEMFESLASMLRISLQRFAEHDNENNNGLSVSSA
jgi:hypothetical protein